MAVGDNRLLVTIDSELADSSLSASSLLADSESKG